MTGLHRIFIVIACSLLMACQSASVRDSDSAGSGKDQGADSFITIQGSQFIKGGQPYYFAGANYWYGAYLAATPEGRDRLKKELDQLQSMGVTNLRVLAASEETALSMALDPAVQTAPGDYSEDLLKGLDHLLVEMSKRDMHAVLFLNNFWQWSGGMSQYIAWSSGSEVLDPDVTGDWNAFMQNSAAFYRDDKAQMWYRQLIEHVVTRENTVSGRKYMEDPTIMAWQLANEPRPGSDAEGRPFFPAYKEWITESARFIKTLDANHLVSTGSEGAMGTLGDIDLYVDAHNSPEIDYLTFHMWPKNWGWFDIQRPEETFQSALTKSRAYILQHIQVAQSMGKPIVLEEFGIERDKGDYRLGSSTDFRDRFFKEIYQLLQTQARLGFPIAGSNFWTWGGIGRAQHPDLIWKPGDPFTGDPPQEPQGLNSVFDVDASTVDIISRHAKVMNVL